MQQDIARDFIVKTCLKLPVSGEVRLDKNVVLSAFRPWPGEDSEDQLIGYLQGVTDAVFLCHRLANGDLVVTRNGAGKPTVNPAAAASPASKPVVPSKPAANAPGKKKRRRKPHKRR